MSERILHVYRDVYLCDPAGERRRLHHPGKLVAKGTVALTDARLLFIPSRGMWEKVWGSPKVRTCEEADRLLVAQGGYAVPAADLTSVCPAGKYASGYADGPLGCSDLYLVSPAAGGARVFRFFGEASAEQCFRAAVPGAAPAGPPGSPVAGELAELDIPADYLLPGPPEFQMATAWLRSTVGFAWRTLKEGKTDFAISDAGKVIDDPRFRGVPPFALGLAAAHYVRGSAWERKGDREKAAADYREALRLQPDYRLARGAQKRIGSRERG